MVTFAEVFGIPAGAIYFVWQNRTEPITILITGIAVVGFVHGISRIFNFKRPKLAVGVALALSGVGCASWYFAVKPTQADEPQLQLMLHSPRFPMFVLVLTNKDLFQPRTNVIHAKMALVIPVTSKDATATLRLVLRNESVSNEVNNFEVGVTFSDNLNVTPETVAAGKDWEYASSQIPNTRAIVATPKQKVFPLRGYGLNDIIFKRNGGWTSTQTGDLLVLSVSADKFGSYVLAMQIVCPVIDVPVEPVLLPAGARFTYP